MYEQHFGLNEPPFMINPNPRFFKITPSHDESLQKCEYAIRNRAGLAVIYGDVGTGKTTLMFELMQRFNADAHKYTIAWTDQVNLRTDTSFLKTIAEEFGVKPRRSKRETFDDFHMFLAKEEAEGRIPLLFVDEAHKLESTRKDRDMLGLIQALTNLVNPVTREKLINIILFGELGLLELIKPHRALKRRVAQFGFLSPLTEADARQVLEYRWQQAGGQLPIPIADEAFAYLYNATKGLPSDLIKCMNSSMIYAFSKRFDHVNLESVKYGVSENQIEVEDNEQLNNQEEHGE